MDTALGAGDLLLLASIATPDARFDTGTKTVPFQEVVTQDRALMLAAPKAARVTTIYSFELKGDTALVGTRSVTALTRDKVRELRSVLSADTWVRIDGGWRLNQSKRFRMEELPPLDSPETSRAVAAELRKLAVPLSGVEAGNPIQDLEAFGKAVGDVRVVSFGGASHGTREVFQLKHRLLEYLVKVKGFTVFAIEANWPESEAADRYIKTGAGDPKAALAAMYFWNLQTEEVLAMLEWMRDFNTAPGDHPILTFTSFDMQKHQVAQERVLEYVKRTVPLELAAVESAYTVIDDLIGKGVRGAGFEDAAKKAEDVVRHMESRRDVFVKASSAAALRNALQMARIVVQTTRRRVGAGPGWTGGSYRDQMMARNVMWLLNEAHPNEKIVLWSHNTHTSKSHGTGRDSEYRPMGSWLHESLGSQLYVLGFAINQGVYRANVFEGGRRIGLSEVRIPKAEEGTGTPTLSSVGIPLFFLNLRNQSGVAGKWLSQPHLFRGFGAGWDVDWSRSPYSNMESTELIGAYDGLIYLERTTAARGLPYKFE